MSAGERARSTPSPPDGLPGVGRAAAWLDGGAAAPRALAAALAWALTVAPVAFSRGSGGGAKALSVAALLAGLGGPWLAPLGRSASRHLGVSAFLALDLSVWLIERHAITPERLEPLRAGLGALAFGVWALAWGDVFRSVGRGTPADGPSLPARSRLPGGAVPVAAVSVLIALGIEGLAWRISDSPRALAAQAVAVAAGVALVAAGATVATSRGAKREPHRRLPGDARRAVALLVTIAVVGIVSLALRGTG